VKLGPAHTFCSFTGGRAARSARAHSHLCFMHTSVSFTPFHSQVGERLAQPKKSSSPLCFTTNPQNVLEKSKQFEICSADGLTHTESNKLYRKVKHRYRPNLTPRQRPTAKARLEQAALAASAEARGATHRARPCQHSLNTFHTHTADR